MIYFAVGYHDSVLTAFPKKAILVFVLHGVLDTENKKHLNVFCNDFSGEQVVCEIEL